METDPADELLAAALAADLDAVFERVVVAHQDRLFTIAFRTGGNRHDAEELVQDCFVRAYRALASYPPARIRDLRLRGWLTTILLNAGRNRARIRRVPTIELAFDPSAGPTADPIARRDERGTWARRLAALSPGQRVAGGRRPVGGLSLPESAAAGGLEPGSADRRRPASCRRTFLRGDRGSDRSTGRHGQGPRPPRPGRVAHRPPRRRAAGDRGGSCMTDPFEPIVEAALAGLREPAPPWLAHATLVAVGLADDYALMDSPLGQLRVGWNARGISTVEQAADDAAFESRFLARTGRVARRVDTIPTDLSWRIARRLGGDRHVRIDLDLRGATAFERAVWTKALEIPRGEVRPYGWIAAEIGRPKAVRAVGTALGHNPVPLIVPCHRVVRSDGMIGQYSLGGPANKRTILSAEGADPNALEQLARAGVRYYGSDTTHIYCMPTCRDARRVTERHLVTFPSARAASAAGYRACKHCRPLGVEAVA